MEITIRQANKKLCVAAEIEDVIEAWTGDYGYETAELVVMDEVVIKDGKVKIVKSKREYALFLDGEVSEITYSFCTIDGGIELMPTHLQEDEDR